MRANYQTIDTQQNTQCITVHTAIETARKFLEQYNSPVIYKSAYLEGKTWIVTMDVGLVYERIIKVQIDSESGRISGYA